MLIVISENVKKYLEYSYTIPKSYILYALQT